MNLLLQKCNSFYSDNGLWEKSLTCSAKSEFIVMRWNDECESKSIYVITNLLCFVFIESLSALNIFVWCCFYFNFSSSFNEKFKFIKKQVMNCRQQNNCFKACTFTAFSNFCSIFFSSKNYSSLRENPFFRKMKIWLYIAIGASRESHSLNSLYKLNFWKFQP